MTTLTVLTVDDEMPARRDLTWLLGAHPSVGRVLEAPGAFAALDVLGADPSIDVVFVDIHMPEMTGLDMARQLQERPDPPFIVFVTAHEEHALSAFELAATDYLLKPVDPRRLDETLDRVVTRRRLVPADDRSDGDEPLTRLTAKVGDVTVVIDRDQVHYVEAAGDYARVHHQRGSHLVREPISTLEAAWSDAGFVRIHRGFLVQVADINEIRTNEGGQSVVLGDAVLPVSRRHRRALRERLGRTGST